MRQLPWIAATLILAAILFFTHLSGSQRATAAPAADDAPQIARQFTPWLTAYVHGKQQTANQYFHLRPAAENDLNNSDAAQLLARLSQVDNLNLNLVWSKTLGDNMGIVMFTLATEDGPIGFKIYYYGFANQMYISHLEMSGHWSDVERMAFIFDPLSGPVATVPLNGQ